MIAAGLAVTAKDGYHLPHKIISERAYPAAILKVVRRPPPRNSPPDSALKEATEAVGAKLSPAKLAALVKDAPKLDDAALRARLQDAVTENDYDNVITSLVTKYCRPACWDWL